MDIPAGYQLTVSSWENDGDFPGECTLYGLTKADVLFYIELAKRFDGSNLGNQDVSTEELINAVTATLVAHPNISIPIKRRYTELKHELDVLVSGLIDDEGAADAYHDLLCFELLGQPVEGYGDQDRFCRAASRLTVHFIESPIKDVTAHFSRIRGGGSTTSGESPGSP